MPAWLVLIHYKPHRSQHAGDETPHLTVQRNPRARPYPAATMLELQAPGGDIFEVDVEALCVPVNARAAAGAGLAKAAAARWPKWLASYKDCCRLGRMTGAEHEIHSVPVLHRRRQSDLFDEEHRLYVVSVPTKYHWREPASYQLIRESLQRLADAALRRPWLRVAVPALGCGLGGLDWPRVLDLMRHEFTDHPSTFLVFPPEETPK